MKLAALEASVTLNTQGFADGIADVQTKMTDTKTQMEGMQTTAQNTGSIFDSALGHALGDFMSDLTETAIRTAFSIAEDGVELAASMEEIQNVVDTTFGVDAADRVNRWAETTKEAFGIGRLSAKEYASTMGATLKGMGIQDDELYEMSTALVGLAGDMASFRNLDTQTTFRKLMSGMTGEMEPLKELGIIMSATNLEAHALAMGIEEDWAKLDSATQTQVRYNYLMQQTADMQGDFAKTSESYSNQMRLLQENIDQLKLSVGESLLPVMTDLVTWFNTLFGSEETATEKIGGMKDAYNDSLGSIEATTANALALVNALDQLSASTEDASSSEVWAAILTELQATIPGISALIDANTGTIEGGTKALRGFVEEYRMASRELAQMQAMQEMYNEYNTALVQLEKLKLDQSKSDAIRQGAEVQATEAVDWLYASILAGMDPNDWQGASARANFENTGRFHMSRFLRAIAGGADPYAAMGEAAPDNIYQLDDRSYMDYFLRGGGSIDDLMAYASSYAQSQNTAGKYNVDNSAAIAEWQAAVDTLATEISTMQDILAADAAKEAAPAGDTTAETTVNVDATTETIINLDGQQIADIVTPKVERAIARNVIMKAK